MIKTIFLHYKINNILIDPYSITLESEDNTYGVKDTEDNIIVPSGQTVLNPSVGVYTYEIDNIEVGKVYFVSWKVITSNGVEPKYVVEEIGPFEEDAVNSTTTIIDAVASYKGSFLPGSYSVVFLKITNFDGIPVNATDISTEILDNTGYQIISGIPIRVADGYYVYEWEIPSTQPTGEYVIIWTYEVNGETKQELQTITVAATVDGVGEYSDKLIVFRAALEKYITCAQSIPVYFEQSKKSRNRQDYEFSFKNWNQSAGCRIYRNGEIQNGGYSIDYFKGKVTFDEPLLVQDIVNADYNFRWFSDEELDRFLQSSVQIFNNYPPVSGFTLLDVFDRYIPLVLYGAAKDALRQLMMCLMFQEPAQVFGGGERAERVFNMIETLKKNYEEDWREIIAQKKFGPYPKMRINIASEMTLPGGRCISLSTKGLCQIEDSVFETDMTTIIELYKKYPNIKILSQDDSDKKLIFAPINHIWLSGEKDVYEIKTKLGYEIRASDEHLFFVNNEYIPLMDIKNGDNLIITNNYKTENDFVKSVKKLRIKEIMCDLEVGKTANLFANGIKCHNSRWFRMMFSSNTG